MKKKGRRKKGSNRKSMFGIVMVVAVLLVSMSVQSSALKQKNEEYEAEKVNIQKQMDSEKQRTKEIEDLEEYMKTDQYIEEMARDKLGLIYEGETIFKPE